MTEIIHNVKVGQAHDINNKWADIVAGQNACHPKHIENGDSQASVVGQPKEHQDGGDTIPGITTKSPVGDPGFAGGRVSTGKATDPGFGGGHIEFPPIPGFGTTPQTTGKGHEY